MESPTVPRHLVASDGKIYAKTENGAKNYTPKTIDYKHTIRIISPFQCCHQGEIQKLRKEKDALLAEKQRQIERLKLLLYEKEKDLQRKDEELLRLNQSKRDLCQNNLKISILDNKLQRSQVTDIFNSCVKSQSTDHYFQNIKSSFILDVGSSECQQLKEVTSMEQELASMQNNLKQLANALNKPKKPYQFYTRGKEDLPSLPTKIQRLSDDFNQQAESASVQCTSTNQSFDASDFLEQAIHEHQVLRDALIELQRSTQAEMKQMRLFYENQIEGYKRLLQRQRDKTNKIDTFKYHKNHHRILSEQFTQILAESIDNCHSGPFLHDND